MSANIDIFKKVNNVSSVKLSELNIYEMVLKISEYMFNNNSDLLNKVTLGIVSEKELEKAIEKEIYKHGFSNHSKAIVEHLLGYGPLQKYIENEECSNVFVNKPDDVWVQIGRERIKTDISFGNLKNLNDYIRTIQGSLGGVLNANEALVKFVDEKHRLRIICSIAPISHLTSTLTIRKHRLENFTLDDLFGMKMFDKNVYKLLERLCDGKRSIMFTGAGGAGKTTLMRAMAEIVDKQNGYKLRILAMEEHPELFLTRPNTIQFLTKRDKGKVYDIKEYTDKGNLMSIDMYMFGEIRGAEALPFFDGALAGNVTWNTAHANSSEVAMKKMAINMKKSGSDVDQSVFEEQLYESIDLIIHMDRFSVLEITEVLKEEKKVNIVYKLDIKNETETFVEGDYIKKSMFKRFTHLNDNVVMVGGEKVC